MESQVNFQDFDLTLTDRELDDFLTYMENPTADLMGGTARETGPLVPFPRSGAHGDMQGVMGLQLQPHMPRLPSLPTAAAPLPLDSESPAFVERLPMKDPQLALQSPLQLLSLPGAGDSPGASGPAPDSAVPLLDAHMPDIAGLLADDAVPGPGPGSLQTASKGGAPPYEQPCSAAAAAPNSK